MTAPSAPAPGGGAPGGAGGHPRDPVDDQLDLVFSALADRTRRAILARLAQGEATVNEIAEPFPISLQAVSKHLKVLERAGLIVRGRNAQWRPCRLEGQALAVASRWIERNRRVWEARLDHLGEVLADMPDE
ncbi:MAG TPA: metalloregulator ArsR/SmtB family transcription factor, partial [Acidimicrobiales bacterium]|nr:metalloregulator ArsR/SmtB family transcription factor [Acidimicrobiales bacterium]